MAQITAESFKKYDMLCSQDFDYTIAKNIGKHLGIDLIKHLVHSSSKKTNICLSDLPYNESLKLKSYLALSKKYKSQPNGYNTILIELNEVETND